MEMPLFVDLNKRLVEASSDLNMPVATALHSHSHFY